MAAIPTKCQCSRAKKFQLLVEIVDERLFVLFFQMMHKQVLSGLQNNVTKNTWISDLR